MREVKCANKDCKWKDRQGNCLLFRGVTQLECKYRIVKPKKTNNTKGGNE